MSCSVARSPRRRAPLPGRGCAQDAARTATSSAATASRSAGVTVCLQLRRRFSIASATSSAVRPRSSFQRCGMRPVRAQVRWTRQCTRHPRLRWRPQHTSTWRTDWSYLRSFRQQPCHPRQRSLRPLTRTRILAAARRNTSAGSRRRRVMARMPPRIGAVGRVGLDVLAAHARLLRSRPRGASPALHRAAMSPPPRRPPRRGSARRARSRVSRVGAETVALVRRTTRSRRSTRFRRCSTQTDAASRSAAPSPHRPAPLHLSVCPHLAAPPQRPHQIVSGPMH